MRGRGLSGAVLALYSFGMIHSKVSGLCAVSLFLSEYLGCTYFALRKRAARSSTKRPRPSPAPIRARSARKAR